MLTLQTVTDELTEQGYGRLPSPTSQEGQEQAPAGSPTVTAPEGQITQSVPTQTPVNPTPGGGSNVTNGPAGSARMRCRWKI